MTAPAASPSFPSSFTPDAQPGYAGDVSPEQACAWVQAGSAVLVDVRTDAERDWVGQVPGAVPLSWKIYPGMELNAGFDAGIAAVARAHPGCRLLFLCRSGVRSVAAATRATELGLSPCFNVLEGFEGGLDAEGHRGPQGGWGHHGLPWVQG